MVPDVPPWIAVLTTTTRTRYLLETLAAIDAAGGAAFRRLVFVDGPRHLAPVAPPGWTAISDGGPPRGSRRATWRVLHLAAVAQLPYLLFFEDDVRLCANAIDAMARIRVPPDLGFLVFCNQLAGLPDTPPAAPAIYPFTSSPDGLPPRHWGNQALKVPDRSLQLFRLPSTEPHASEYRFASDVWLVGQLRTFGIVLPAIVRHVGAETTIPSQQGEGLDGHRAGLNYAGDGYDARGIVAVAQTSSTT